MRCGAAKFFFFPDLYEIEKKKSREINVKMYTLLQNMFWLPVSVAGAMVEY